MYEFVDDFWVAIAQQVSALCAAGEFPAHSGSGGNGLPGQSGEKNEDLEPESTVNRVEMEV